MNIVERKRRLSTEVLAMAGQKTEEYAASADTGNNTDENDSEEVDIFER